MSNVIYIGAVAVETDSVLTAAKVAAKATETDTVRGTITVAGKKHRWSTIQQYEQHGGFTRKRGYPELDAGNARPIA